MHNELSPPEPASTASNPYAANLPPLPPLDRLGQRPGGLTAVGVLCIVGGIVGALSGLLALLNSLFGEAMASAFTTSGSQQAAQEQLYAQMKHVADKYYFLTLAASIGTFLVGLGLLVGGIGFFRSPPRGRRLIRSVFVAAIILELLRAVSYSLTQFEMMPIMASYMQQVMGQAGAGLAPSAMGQMMRAMAWVGIVMWLLWAAVKIGLYIAGRRYLNRSYVVDYFAATKPLE